MSRPTPRSIALCSKLHGGPCPDIAKLCVLEVGCGAGENLLAQAFYDRASSFLGVDHDADALEVARSAAAELGLSNLRFVSMEEGDGALAGPFDVVILRDYLARVPEVLRRAALGVVAQRLAPQGLVFVDYPLAPAGTFLDAVHRMVAAAALGEEIEGDDVPRRVERAKAASAALAAMIVESPHPYPKLLSAELDRLSKASPLEVARDCFGESRQVFRHGEIVDLFAEHGLSFVGDAAFNRPEGLVPPEVRAAVAKVGPKGARLEEALDVLRYRASRSSIFCRDSVEPTAPPGPELLDELTLSSSLAPIGEPRLDPGVDVTFEGESARIASKDPLLKASLLVLAAAHPEPMSFAAVMGHAVTRLHQSGAEGHPSDDQVAGVAGDLWTMAHRGLIELSLGGSRASSGTGKRLHALARYQARIGLPLTTPEGTAIELKGFEGELIRQMAEETDNEVVVVAMVHAIASGELSLELAGARLTDPLVLTPMVKGLMDRALAVLGRAGLLS